MIAYTTDYSNRQVDIEVLQTILKPAGNTAMKFSITSSSPKAVTGMQKLVQRYTLLLLTQLGTVRFATDQGTTFMSDLIRGAGQNSGQVAAVVAFANLSVMQELQVEDQNTDLYGEIPSDEQLKSATLLDFTVNTVTGVLSLSIQLLNYAGSAYTYVLPVTAISGG